MYRVRSPVPRVKQTERYRPHRKVSWEGVIVWILLIPFTSALTAAGLFILIRWTFTGQW